MIISLTSSTSMLSLSSVWVHRDVILMTYPRSADMTAITSVRRLMMIVNRSPAVTASSSPFWSEPFTGEPSSWSSGAAQHQRRPGLHGRRRPVAGLLRPFQLQVPRRARGRELAPHLHASVRARAGARGEPGVNLGVDQGRVAQPGGAALVVQGLVPHGRGSGNRPSPLEVAAGHAGDDAQA